MTEASLKIICDTIGREEGFGLIGSRATRNHNPGNLWDGLVKGKAHRIWPYIPIDDEGFLILNSDYEGWQMLKHDIFIKAYVHGFNIRQAVTQFAPPKEHIGRLPQNNTEQYISIICKALGN